MFIYEVKDIELLPICLGFNSKQAKYLLKNANQANGSLQHIAESFSVNIKVESCMYFPFTLRNVMHCGSQAGNDKEWAQNNEENTHFKLSVNRYAVMGIYCFSMKIEIIIEMLSLFSEFPKKKCSAMLMFFSRLLSELALHQIS